ncbi:peptidyl-prolyl cis-trans isomerase [Paenibacillus oryzisoli]|uniref:peptidylprolyl isomerase n=1 Tax=Paenibacillus oryzisoli TaxID=1850517 RepID=UPI003D2E562E
MQISKLWKGRPLQAWGGVIVIATLVLSGCMKLQAQGNPDSAGVAVVNGQIVEAREFAAALSGERSKTYAYFQDKYGAEDSPSFWNQNYQGEVPLAKIEQDVLQKVVRTKVQQALGVQLGVLQDASYSAFLRELAQENARRQKEVNSGRPVYGPKQLTEKAFYEMRQSELLDDLKMKLSGGAAVSEADIQAFYDKNSSMFVRAGTVHVKMISTVTTGGGVSKEEAKRSLQAIARRVAAGEDFAAVTGDVCRSQSSKYTCREQQFSSDTARKDTLASPLLTTAVKELAKGQLSEVFEEQQVLTLVQCTDRLMDTLLPLTAVKDAIAAKLSDQAFERRLQEEVDRAQLTLNKEVLEAVESQVLMSK